VTAAGRCLGVVCLAACGWVGWVTTGAAQGLETSAAAAGPEWVVGSWAGALSLPGNTSLRLVAHIELDEEGELSASVDSPDQGVTGMPVAQVGFRDGTLTLELTAIGARYVGTVGPDGALEGSWMQGGQSLPLRLERVEGDAVGPRRPQDPEPPFPYGEEEVRYPNPGAEITLAGTLTLPEGDGPFPAVVLVSGSGAQDRNSEVFGHRLFLVLADHLTRRGIAVLRSDDRGVGESEGVFSEATSRDFADDAEAAVEWLRTHPGIDSGAVGIVGMSEGGAIAPMVAARSDAVAFIVLMAGPGLPGEEILYLQGELIGRAEGVPDEQLRWNRSLQERMFALVREEEDEARRAERMAPVLREALAELPEATRSAMGLADEAAREAWIRGQIAGTSGPWLRFFLTHDPREVLREVRVPVLALNGELDLQVPSAENLREIEAALEEAGNPDVTVRELPGLNHLFQTARTGSPAEYGEIEETMSPEAMEAVARWILERVGEG
jgi:uncharacterized protein